MQPIVTLTLNPAVDESTSVENVMPEHKLRCARPERHPGGGGINVARAVHKLGGQATAHYLAGGPTGQLLQEMLAAEGVAQQPFPIADITRTSFTVFESSSRLQYRFNMPGPRVTEEEAERLLAQLRTLDPAPAYIVASGSLPPEMPRDYYARVAGVAADVGARLILDTSGEPLQLALEAGVYLIKPNANEFRMLLGLTGEQEVDVERMAWQVVESGKAQVVLVSLGAAGAVVATRNGIDRIPAPVVPVQSKVGAGDSMVGGVTLALARGEPLARAARFGVAAGTAAIMTPGTLLCRREDAERLFDNIMGEDFRPPTLPEQGE